MRGLTATMSSGSSMEGVCAVAPHDARTRRPSLATAAASRRATAAPQVSVFVRLY